jgi:hypothetical protein
VPTQEPEEEIVTEREPGVLDAAAKRKAKMARYADQPQGPKKRREQGRRRRRARKRATPEE